MHCWSIKHISLIFYPKLSLKHEAGQSQCFIPPRAVYCLLLLKEEKLYMPTKSPHNRAVAEVKPISLISPHNGLN